MKPALTFGLELAAWLAVSVICATAFGQMPPTGPTNSGPVQFYYDRAFGPMACQPMSSGWCVTTFSNQYGTYTLNGRGVRDIDGHVVGYEFNSYMPIVQPHTVMSITFTDAIISSTDLVHWTTNQTLFFRNATLERR